MSDYGQIARVPKPNAPMRISPPPPPSYAPQIPHQAQYTLTQPVQLTGQQNATPFVPQIILPPGTQQNATPFALPPMSRPCVVPPPNWSPVMTQNGHCSIPTQSAMPFTISFFLPAYNVQPLPLEATRFPPGNFNQPEPQTEPQTEPPIEPQTEPLTEPQTEPQTEAQQDLFDTPEENNFCKLLQDLFHEISVAITNHGQSQQILELVNQLSRKIISMTDEMRTSTLAAAAEEAAADAEAAAKAEAAADVEAAEAQAAADAEAADAKAAAEAQAAADVEAAEAQAAAAAEAKAAAEAEAEAAEAEAEAAATAEAKAVAAAAAAEAEAEAEAEAKAVAAAAAEAEAKAVAAAAAEAEAKAVAAAAAAEAEAKAVAAEAAAEAEAAAKAEAAASVKNESDADKVEVPANAESPASTTASDSDYPLLGQLPISGKAEEEQSWKKKISETARRNQAAAEKKNHQAVSDRQLEEYKRFATGWLAEMKIKQSNPNTSVRCAKYQADQMKAIEMKILNAYLYQYKTSTSDGFRRAMEINNFFVDLSTRLAQNKTWSKETLYHLECLLAMSHNRETVVRLFVQHKGIPDWYRKAYLA